MTDKKLIRDIEQAKKRRSFPALGIMVALISMTYGEFIIRVDGYLLAHSEPYLSGLPEDLIGALLLGFGLVKFIAIFAQSNRWKRVGIIGLSALWSGLFAVAVTFSFGSGFPHPSWQFALFVAAICLLESRRGDYGY